MKSVPDLLREICSSIFAFSLPSGGMINGVRALVVV